MTSFTLHGMPHSEPVAEARAALAALDRLLSAVESAQEPAKWFDAANELVERSRALPGLLASVRTEATRALWESERMTLATLADRIGVSTARAHQIIGNIRAPKKGSVDERDDERGS